MNFIQQSPKHLGLLAICCSVLLAACSNNQEVTIKETQSESTVQSVGKPSAPITMDFQLLTQNPKAGETIEIAVNFKSSVKSTIQTQVKAPEKLTWLNEEQSWTTDLQKNNQTQSLPNVKVVAPVDGRYFIHFVATVEQDGELMSKPFTIKLDVGDGPFELASDGEIITDENGDKVKVYKVDNQN